jgi:hypothetical protein
MRAPSRRGRSRSTPTRSRPRSEAAARLIRQDGDASLTEPGQLTDVEAIGDATSWWPAGSPLDNAPLL